MTSASPVIKGPCRLPTHKDYAVEEVKALIKPTDVDLCAELGTEELGALALFDLTRVSPLLWWILSCFSFSLLLFLLLLLLLLLFFFFFFLIPPFKFFVLFF